MGRAEVIVRQGNTISKKLLDHAALNHPRHIKHIPFLPSVYVSYEDQLLFENGPVYIHHSNDETGPVSVRLNNQDGIPHEIFPGESQTFFDGKTIITIRHSKNTSDSH